MSLTSGCLSGFNHCHWDSFILKYSSYLLSTTFCSWVLHPTDYRGSCGTAVWESSCSSDSCYEAKRKYFNCIIESYLFLVLLGFFFILYYCIQLCIDVLQSICISTYMHMDTHTGRCHTCSSIFQAALLYVKS